MTAIAPPLTVTPSVSFLVLSPASMSVSATLDHPLAALEQFEQSLRLQQIEAIQQAECEARLEIEQAQAQYQADLQAIQFALQERVTALEAAQARLQAALVTREKAQEQIKRIRTAVSELSADPAAAEKAISLTLSQIGALVREAIAGVRAEQQLHANRMANVLSENEAAQQRLAAAVDLANQKVTAVKNKYSLAAEFLQAQAEIWKQIDQATTKDELTKLRDRAKPLGLNVAARIRARREALRVDLLRRLPLITQPNEIEKLLAEAKAAGELHAIEGPAARHRHAIIRQGWEDARAFAENLAHYGDEADRQVSSGNILGYWPGNVWVYAMTGPRQWQLVLKFTRSTGAKASWNSRRMTTRVLVAELPKHTIQVVDENESPEPTA